MKYVLTAQLTLCLFVVSCSTTVTPGSADNTAGNKTVAKKTSTNSTTVRTTGIRTMQKYFRPAGEVSGTVRIVIDKSDFQLRVYDRKGILATYPVVFGLKPLEDKMMQGDRRTPEGTFKVVYNQQHKLWRKMLMLDYPTKESAAKFNNRKSNGLIPAFARIGNGIGIHGVEPGNDYFIDRFYNWTNGCISLKNPHMDDLARYVKPGTVVVIQK